MSLGLVIALSIIGGLFIVAIISELVVRDVYGGIIRKKLRDTYMHLEVETDYTLNKFNPEILSLARCGRSFISTVSFSPSSKYYIDNVGLVPRGTDLHKKIGEYFEKAEEYQRNNQ